MSESIAVGSGKFVDTIHQQLGLRVKGRSVAQEDVGFVLKEAGSTYSTFFSGEKSILRLVNGFLWNKNDENTV